MTLIKPERAWRNEVSGTGWTEEWESRGGGLGSLSVATTVQRCREVSAGPQALAASSQVRLVAHLVAP